MRSSSRSDKPPRPSTSVTWLARFSHLDDDPAKSSFTPVFRPSHHPIMSRCPACLESAGGEGLLLCCGNAKYHLACLHNLEIRDDGTVLCPLCREARPVPVVCGNVLETGKQYPLTLAVSIGNDIQHSLANCDYVYVSLEKSPGDIAPVTLLIDAIKIGKPVFVDGHVPLNLIGLVNVPLVLPDLKRKRYYMERNELLSPAVMDLMTAAGPPTHKRLLSCTECPKRIDRIDMLQAEVTNVKESKVRLESELMDIVRLRRLENEQTTRLSAKLAMVEKELTLVQRDLDIVLEKGLPV